MTEQNDRQKEIIKVLLDLILSIDPSKISTAELFETIKPQLAVLSRQMHVARMETYIHTEPNIYEPDGREQCRRNDFTDDAAPEEEALVLRFERISHTQSTTKIYPRKGYTWNEEEREIIAAVGQLIYIHVSRIHMIEMQQKIALTDPLTGLNNTPGAIRFCSVIREKYNIEDYASCFINLKNLKYINQMIDNKAGDDAMHQYAMNLNRMLDPEREQLARFGGDNFFAVVLKTHLDEFVRTASEMPLDIGQPGRKQSIVLGAWVGIYQAVGKENPRDLLDYASFAYERAKKTKSTITYFTPAMMEASMHARKVSQTMPRAMKKHEIMPYYQPKVSLHTGKLQGCEALARWIKDSRVIAPSDFLTVAEDSDLIAQLDLYMLDAVCQDIRKWLDAGMEPVPVSINYSQRDFYLSKLIDKTLATLQKHRIDGKYIEIEITESSYFENFDALENFVNEMHRYGVRVSLDDFGTGYSSLTLLERLNLDTVKLDRSFFQNMDTEKETSKVVLHSIAGMLNRMRKNIVSEGVETKAQLDLVDEIGCDVVQGFYFDRPLPYTEYTERLKKGKYELEQ